MQNPPQIDPNLPRALQGLPQGVLHATDPRHVPRTLLAEEQARQLTEELLAGALSIRSIEAFLLRAQAAYLAYIADSGRVQDLGFDSMGNLAREILYMRPRTARERLMLHRILSVSPLAQEAFLDGRLTSCQILALAPMLKGDEETAASWIAQAQGLSVVELRKRVKQAKPEVETDEERFCTVSFRVPLEFVLVWRQMMELARRVLGWQAPQYRCLEAILAEAGASGLGAAPDGAAPDAEARAVSHSGVVSQRGLNSAGLAPHRRPIPSQALEHARQTLAELREYLARLSDLIESEAPTDAFDAFSRLQQLHRLRAPLHALLARLLRDICKTRALALLGYDHVQPFVEQRLGFSMRKAQNLIADSYLFEDYPLLETSYARGQIGAAQAHLIRKVSHGWDMEKHRDRARVVMLRQFERECDFLFLLRKCDPKLAARFAGPLPRAGLEKGMIRELCRQYGWTREKIEEEFRGRGIDPLERGAPRDPADNLVVMERLELLLELLTLAVWRESARIEAQAEAQTSATARAPISPGRPAHRLARRAAQLFAPSRSEIYLRIRLPEPVRADLEAAVERIRQQHAEALLFWEALVLLFAPVAQTWNQQDPESRPVRWKILLRDEYRCSTPGCTRRRDLEVHHIEFRSEGGGDEDWNLSVVCHGHHAHVIHEGRGRMWGRAPQRLYWELGCRRGHRPLMRLRGEKILEGPWLSPRNE